LLDKKKVKTERLKWQLINTVLPLLALLLFGLIHNIIRKRKYAK
jgi:ABC-2 type transport system permease protein